MEKYCPTCFKKFPRETERCPHDGSNLVSPEDRDLSGQELDDRYTVLDRVGRGGMGVVYRAEQKIIKRIVALKVLRREVVQDESAVKRFLTEAKAIASLDSRHTVTLFDFGVTRDGLLYYTMELLKGQPLTRLIRQNGPLEASRAVRFVLQICDSLEEAHEHGILHRDLKPDNLFVVERRGKEDIKVLDFGIAKLVGDGSVESVTQTGMIVGTPQYLSPEQALGNPVVPASDLYSLGIVLYEMLAGSPPFQGETPMKTMWAHVRDPVPPLRTRNPEVEVPRSIEMFLQRALEKEPGKRFQNVSAFRDALRRAMVQHDASPETVGLPPLSTSSDGLRIKTEEWGPEKETPSRTQTAELSEKAPTPVCEREERTASGPGSASIGGATANGKAETVAVPSALPQPTASSEVEMMAAAAAPIPAGELASRTEGGPVQTGASRNRPVAETGSTTLLRSERRRWVLGLAIVGAVGLALALGVWQPWQAKVTSSTDEGKAMPLSDTSKTAAEQGTRPEGGPKENSEASPTGPAVTQRADQAPVTGAAVAGSGSTAGEHGAKETVTAAGTVPNSDEVARRAAEAQGAPKKAAEDASATAAQEAERVKAEQEEAAKAAAWEAEQQKKEDEAARKQAVEEDERKKKKEAAKEKAHGETGKGKAEGEAAKKSALDAERMKKDEGAARKKAAEEAAKKALQEAERKTEEEAAKKKAAEKAKAEAASPADDDFDGMKLK